MDFVSLHSHTQYSNVHLIDCIIKPKNLINKALKLGFKGVAITDHECLSGAVELLRIRDQIRGENPDFKIIFGNEIYLIDESELNQNPKYNHFILLAKDLEGWEQLKLLSSRAWTRSYVERGCRRTPTTYQDIEEIVGSNPGHILSSSACLGGALATKILAHDVPGANQFVKWCIKVFGKDNFALELQPGLSDEQITVNQTLLKFAKHYGIRPIVTTDTHYLDKEDFNIHKVFLNSKQNKDRETELFYRYTYMMTIDEMVANLRQGGISQEDAELVINNTVDFTKDIQDFDFRHDTIIPCPDVPDFKLEHLLKPYYEKYECIGYYANSKYDQDQYLLHLIEQGIKSKHIVVDDKQADRINTELDVLRYITDANNQPVSGYLNLVRKIEDIIYKTSIIGVSRGSAMSFYINYLIGIVQANPLAYDIPYWRFLNKARSGAGNWPDVDIDVMPSQTDNILKLLADDFGHDNVIQCATFKTESLKSAVLTACRGLNIDVSEAQALSALIPVVRGKVYSLSDCVNGNEEQDKEPAPQFVEKLKQFDGLYDAVEKIEGLVSGCGIHASAVYITKQPYLKYVPCMRAPNGTLITAMNMHDSDECGVMKFDLLRTDAEDKIAKALSLLLQYGQIEWKGNLKDTYMYYLHPDHLVYDNKQMWKDAANGKIANLFQFETPVGGVCIKKTRPENIKQMGAANAVMRLQASDGGESPIDRYVRFRNDINEWYKEMDEWGLTKEEQQVLIDMVGHKFGCSVEQEDMLLIAMRPEIANFSLKDANILRKGVAKKSAKTVEEMKKKFFEAADD